ncbi:hypothetical protein A6R68_21412 [Neotoma lepida]|uniref:Uncharacterized protein n=1 Tax=Neotoma lepida TaxID=56216 RepID=A0A1A6HQ54_NEOLE|nr:hypothetical protein A6R68_21412 [Neotoma lepida]
MVAFLILFAIGITEQSYIIMNIKVKEWPWRGETVKDRLEIFRLASFLRSFSRSFSSFLPKHEWPSCPMFLP